ncbi:MAG: hypothetical protein LLF75_00755 [Eubacteriales bacterium]|nr:hypothetical protein [Eubacteriales bacterium]
MRMQTKRTLFRKRTPEELERAYRQMRLERELERRDAHWFALRAGWPKS